MKIETGNQVEIVGEKAKIYNRTRNRVWSQTVSRIDTHITNRIWNDIEIPIGYWAGNQVYEQIEEPI